MSNAVDEVAWYIWRKQEVKESGNNPAGWIAISNNLLESGALLTSAYSDALVIMLRNVRNGGAATDKPQTVEEEAIVQRGKQTHSVGLMLYGFAIECLLKATYLKRGELLYRDGMYRKPKGLESSHNLLEIAEAVGCSILFTAYQRDVLDLLSARNEMGRYPVHSSYKNYGIDLPAADGTARFYGIWGPRESTTVFEILNILYKHLGEVILFAADALLKEGRVVRTSYELSDEPDKAGRS